MQSLINLGVTGGEMVEEWPKNRPGLSHSPMAKTQSLWCWFHFV